MLGSRGDVGVEGVTRVRTFVVNALVLDVVGVCVGVVAPGTAVCAVGDGPDFVAATGARAPTSQRVNVVGVVDVKAPDVQFGGSSSR